MTLLSPKSIGEGEEEKIEGEEAKIQENVSVSASREM